MILRLWLTLGLSGGKGKGGNGQETLSSSILKFIGIDWQTLLCRIYLGSSVHLAFLFLPKPLKSWLWRLVDPRNCRGCSAERYNLKTKAIGICKRNCLCICRDLLGSYMLRNKITLLYCCFSCPWFVSHLKFNPLCSASSWFSQVAENGSFQTAQWLSCLG